MSDTITVFKSGDRVRVMQTTEMVKRKLANKKLTILKRMLSGKYMATDVNGFIRILPGHSLMKESDK